MRFLSNEEGAVTVDWVVLTAGLVGLGMAAMTVVSSGVQDLSTDIDEELSTSIISTSFSDPLAFYATSGFSMLQNVAGGCYRNVENVVVCTNGLQEYERTYWMSDGSEYTLSHYEEHHHYHNDLGGGSATTGYTVENVSQVWTDGNGEVVAAEDLPEFPEGGLSYSETGPDV